MYPLSQSDFDAAMMRLGIHDISSATIRQICALAAELEKIAGKRMVHLEIGNPGLPAENVGVEAEIKALQTGIANIYPNINGIPELKEAGSKFLKAFVNIDVPAQGIIPTVGSMQGSFTLMLQLSRLKQGKDTMLFLDPGFPAQHTQASLLGLKETSFDIYEYRGEKLEAKLESILSQGNITGMIYCNPNNPAWTNLTEQELEIIGRMATKYDVIVLEDMAYFGMDDRIDISVPYCEPYAPSVARYTDNYIILLSASKIFSYAGQRIAMICISPELYNRKYPRLAELCGIEKFGDSYVLNILYAASSGTAHSAQHAMAEMLTKAVDGELPFIQHCREYAAKAKRAKKLFTENGFHIVYSMDGDRPISDGFFFTAGYGDMTGAELQSEMLRYGIASISLASAGSRQQGVRICISMIPDDAAFEQLESHLQKFHQDHKA